jgi:hypothetical protein
MPGCGYWPPDWIWLLRRAPVIGVVNDGKEDLVKNKLQFLLHLFPDSNAFSSEGGRSCAFPRKGIAMKTNIRAVSLAILAAVASLSPALHAQPNLLYAKVNVPFSFDYGSKHFSHGIYTLTMKDQNTLTIRSDASTAMAMVQTDYTPVREKTSQVIFRKYGDRYFLEEVLVSGSATHVAVLESGAEKRAARELASWGGSASEVALALLPAGIIGK